MRRSAALATALLLGLACLPLAAQTVTTTPPDAAHTYQQTTIDMSHHWSLLHPFTFSGNHPYHREGLIHRALDGTLFSGKHHVQTDTTISDYYKNRNSEL